MLPSSDIVSSGTFSSSGDSCSSGGAQSWLKEDSFVFPESREL